MPIRLLALDLDGTLLNSSKRPALDVQQDDDGVALAVERFILQLEMAGPDLRVRP